MIHAFHTQFRATKWGIFTGYLLYLEPIIKFLIAVGIGACKPIGGKYT